MAPHLKVVQLNVADLASDPRNARAHPERNIEAIMASLQRWGQQKPIVVDSGHVVRCGNGVLESARRLGWEKIACVVTDLTGQELSAFAIADNRTGELSEWDMEQLRLQLGELQLAEFDLDVLAFDEDELAHILEGVNGAVGSGQGDPDHVPEPPDKAISRRGEVYQLGTHRLMCGDSASADDLAILVGGQPIHLVNTDPPYNVKVEPRSNNAIAYELAQSGGVYRRKGNVPAAAIARMGSMASGENSPAVVKARKNRDARELARVATKMHHQSMDLARFPGKANPTCKMRAKDRVLVNDYQSDDDFRAWLLACCINFRSVLVPGGVFYLWGGYLTIEPYVAVMKLADLKFSQAIIWDKEHPVLTRKDFMGAHEWAFYGWKPGAGHHFYGQHNVSDVWHVKKVNPQSMIHLTEKPVELAVRAIEYSSLRGENVLDLFGGSGSTIIGCEQTGRHGFSMEIDELYCDVIRRRWAEFVTGEGCDWAALTPVVAGPPVAGPVGEEGTDPAPADAGATEAPQGAAEAVP